MLAGRFIGAVRADVVRWLTFAKLKPDGAEVCLGMDDKEYADFAAMSENQQGRLVARIRKYLGSFRGKLPVQKSLEFFVDSGRACGNRSR